MSIGYVFGCMISVLFWKFDRYKIFCKTDNFIKLKVKNANIRQLIYIIICFILYLCFFRVSSHNEIFNFITAFIVINISNIESRLLNKINKNDKEAQFKWISLLTEVLICGFVAPLFYILVFNNIFGIIYCLLYYLSRIGEYRLFNNIIEVLNIIPSFILQILLYIIYIIKNRTLKINFNGEFIRNIYMRPLFNVDIIIAYLEDVRFYCYDNKSNRIKSYGIRDKSGIDLHNIKHCIHMNYVLCIFMFIIFYVVLYLKSK